MGAVSVGGGEKGSFSALTPAAAVEDIRSAGTGFLITLETNCGGDYQRRVQGIECAEFMQHAA
jgi:hypothetical protein